MFDVIKGDLEILEQGLQEAVTSPNELVTEVGMHLVTSGGKRIRPALCLLSARGGKAFDLPHVLPLAEALELIHTASLVHDDVIDEADTRRGAATANARWNNQVAILSGDYIFARAFALLAEAGYGDYVSKRLAELVCNLSVGEIIQDHAVYQASRGMADYYERIQKKTADFLEICCELGGLVGGMDKEAAEKLAEYGHCIGMAFQIQDDVLDVIGNEALLGKPVHSDEKNEKTTWVTVYGLEQAKKDVAEYSEEAMAILAQMTGVTEPEKSFLYDFVEYLIHRNK